MNKLGNYFNLIVRFAWADFKLKYYGSILGLFWSILKPFLMLGILYVVFYHFLKITIPNYPLFLLLGIIIWNFFSDTTKDSIGGIVSKSHLLKQINIPPIMVVISTVTHSSWSFIINLLIFLAIFFAAGLHISLSALFLVVSIILLILLITGVSSIVVVLFMRFKDFAHLWDVFLQLLFWATPVVYGLNVIPSRYLWAYLLNPLSKIITDARNSLLYGTLPSPGDLIMTILIISAILFIGVFFFNKHSRGLIDEL